MVRELIDDQVDMYQFPVIDKTPGKTAVIGDLHANSIRFLYFLFRQGIIHFKDSVASPEQRFQDFIKLYEDFEELSKRRNIVQGELSHYSQAIAHLPTRRAKASDPDEIKRFDDLEIEYKTSLGNWTEQLNAIDEELDALHLMDNLQAFINDLSIDLNPKAVTLIGDELADRGANDVFIIEIIKFLRANGVAVSILVSNHGNEFVTAYENLLNNGEFKPLNAVNDSQKPSFVGLCYLLERGIISKEYLVDFAEKTYKPALCLYEYGLDKDGITIYSHAPIEFAERDDEEHSINSIKYNAQKFGVEYRDDTPVELAYTLEKINTAFAKMRDENNLHSLTALPSDLDEKNLTKSAIQTHPVAYTVWNRFDAAKDRETARPGIRRGYQVRYVHGHDDYLSKFDHVINLDTNLGKMPRAELNKMMNEAIADLNDENRSPVEKNNAQVFLNKCSNYKVLISKEKKLSLNQIMSVMDIEKAIASGQEQRAVSGTEKLASFFGKKTPGSVSSKVVELEKARTEEMAKIQSSFSSTRASRAMTAIQAQMSFLSYLTLSSPTEMFIVNELLNHAQDPKDFAGLCLRIEQSILKKLTQYLSDQGHLSIDESKRFYNQYKELSARFYRENDYVALGKALESLADEIRNSGQAASMRPGN